jgi:hypothetical protein
VQPIARIYTGAGSLPCAPHLRFATSDTSLRNQLSTHMECLIQELGFWNGSSCHLIVKRLFPKFALIGNASAQKFPRKTSRTRGIFDEEASRKPLAFAADAVSYGI